MFMEKESKLVFFLKKMAKQSYNSSQREKTVEKLAIKAERMSHQVDQNSSCFKQIHFSQHSSHNLRRKHEKHHNYLYKSLESNTGGTQSQRSKVNEQSNNVIIKSEGKKVTQLQSIDENERTSSRNKLYQMPISTNRLKQKCDRNLVSFVKIPNQEEQATATISQCFNTYLEFKQIMTKMSEQSQINKKMNDSPENKFQNMGIVVKNNKKCSIIPALRPTPYRQKANQSTHKPQSNIIQFEEYMKTRRKKVHLQKSLIVQSKKQELASHIISRYKLKSKLYRQEERLKTFEYDSLNVINDLKEDNDRALEDVEEVLKLQDDKSNKQSLSTKRQKTHRTKQQRNISFFFNNHSEEGVYDQKIRTYRELLFLINIAHRVFDPLPIIDSTVLKQEKVNVFRPTYYIGSGNNSALVRSLMKRRIWWDEVKQFQNANFVWTQLKIPSIFNTQTSFGNRIFDQNVSQDRQVSESKDENQILVPKKLKRQRKSSKDQLSVDKLLVSQKCIYSAFENKKEAIVANLYSNVPKGLIFRAPFAVHDQQKILTENDSKYYRKAIERASRGDSDMFQPRLKSFPKDYLSIKAPSDKLQMHNHFERNHSLGNKKALFYHMQLYYKLAKKPINKAFPVTFHIRLGESDPQFKKFLVEHQRIAKQERYLKNIWILKPGENSNRGCGITVIKEIKILKNLLRGREKHKNGEQKTFILQKYIERPLLYRGRKFDIRHYMIISGLHGKIRAYWYGEGYIRTSSYTFNLEEVNDPMIHLTNDAIQKECDDYGCYEQGNKISYNQLQKYFSKELPEKKFDFSSIFGKMRELARDAVMATYVSLDPSSKLHNFQVFGLDFMIDQNMDVILIQVNTNPCLELSCNLLGRIIPIMLQQSFRVALDPIFPPSAHYTNNTRHLAPDCSLQKLQMELIFDSGRDGLALTELYKQNEVQYNEMLSMLQGSEKQLDEVYDNEGVEIQFQKLIS